MKLKITRRIVSDLLAHSRRASPLEACGYLAQRDGLVDQLYPLTNMDQAPDHFSMDQIEQFRVIRKIRQQGRELRAVYHSHPVTPARPSAEDIRFAADPSVSYLIVSLADHERSVRSFRIQQGKVEAERLVIVD